MQTPGQTSRRVLPPGEYMIEDNDKAAVCCGGCHYEPSDVAFCQITLALVLIDGSFIIVHVGDKLNDDDVIQVPQRLQKVTSFVSSSLLRLQLLPLIGTRRRHVDQ